ncbi:MAG: L,D-transpeptidase family protein [Firmicutes bacterium]|nr:L,D-transpeptidase family protein [Bacillota bacterium]
MSLRFVWGVVIFLVIVSAIPPFSLHLIDSGGGFPGPVEANPSNYRIIVPKCQCGATYRSLCLTHPHLRGHDVAELQERLLTLGFFEGKVDGIFGISTDSAVREFQKAVNMEPTGLVTDLVWLRMGTGPSRTLPAIADLPPGERRIVVDVNTLVLTFYVGDEIIKRYPIAIGKWHTPTPVGEFVIIDKDYAPGGAFGTRWMGLNVPWGGYGIHGTNKPWSIGSAASAGCIRMLNEDVEELFELAPIKTRVEIIGEEPKGDITRNLRMGDTGHDVQVLQYYLRRGAFDTGPLDGRFGPRVDAAVREMQKLYGFPPTGRVGLNELYLLGLR